MQDVRKKFHCDFSFSYEEQEILYYKGDNLFTKDGIGIAEDNHLYNISKKFYK